MIAIASAATLLFLLAGFALSVALIRTYSGIRNYFEAQGESRTRGEVFVACEVAKHNRAMREAGQAVIRG